VSRGEQDACARREEGGGEEEWPTERKSPASSAMLRRAILVAGGLTTGNWCEHGLREGERGSGQNGGTGGALRWPERQCR
jgi:hypothetical protein